MKKILIMTNISLTQEWTDVHNRSNTQGRNINTIEKAKQVIELVYKDQLDIQDYEISDTEIYVICKNDITPCTNCQNNL